MRRIVQIMRVHENVKQSYNDLNSNLNQGRGMFCVRAVGNYRITRSSLAHQDAVCPQFVGHYDKFNKGISSRPTSTQPPNLLLDMFERTASSVPSLPPFMPWHPISMAMPLKMQVAWPVPGREVASGFLALLCFV